MSNNNQKNQISTENSEIMSAEEENKLIAQRRQK